MRRREFITLVGGAAAAWPLSAQAQQPMPVIGFLSGRSLASDAHLVKAFRDGLGDGGYVEGRNIVVEFRWAEGKSEQLTALATNLVAHRVDVVFAGGIDVGIGIRELRTTLANVPIVYAIGGDPVAFGLAASLGRPGGNATGMTVMTATLWPKRLEILRELVGHIDTVAVLIDPANATAALAAKDIKAAARDVGQRIILVNAYAQTEFDAVFATIARERAGALLVSDDPVFINGRDKFIALAAFHAVPTIYGRREFPADGGLASYGASVADQYRQCGRYVGRILAGANPADLPFLQPTRFELVINNKTARALGLTVRQSLVVAADELIE